jgi:membrane protein implicated in regulation of membrane protease activity
MQLWQILSISGIIFIILELFTPSMFFLNFALAGFICAVVSLFYTNIYGLAVLFFVLSFVSFVFLRPILIKRISKETETGLKGKYIGQVVKTNEDISDSQGVINIYGERWEARSDNGEFIPKGSDVKIVRNESIIMYVEKIEK